MGKSDDISNISQVAIDAAKDGIAIITKDGILSYANEAVFDIHGIPQKNKENYIGKHWSELYSKTGQDFIFDVVEPHMNENEEWQGEAKIRRRDNNEIAFTELALKKLPDGGMIGQARDITERIDAQNEKELLQKQIFQSQRMEAVGRLAGGIAHDFNNILASIMGYADFLIEDLDEQKEEQHFAKQIMRASAQARGLVEQILTFSRQKSDFKETINVYDSISETLEICKSTFPETITIDFEAKKDDFFVDMNMSQFSQILMNLIVNAKDAIEESPRPGSIKIRIDRMRSDQIDFDGQISDILPEDNYTPQLKISPKDDSHSILAMGTIAQVSHYMVLSVQDDGKGIPRFIMDHMLEPFFTTKDMDKGTGLGLSTIMGIVCSHRGALQVESVINEFTSFKIYIPISGADGAIDGLEEEVPDTATEGSEDCILIVEDQSDVRLMMEQMVKRLGYSCVISKDGRDAIDYLRENPEEIALIISDYQMPNLNGLDMLREIYQDFPDIPSIILTGYNSEELKDKASDIPLLKDIIKKPAQRNTLGAAIKDALS